MPPVSPQDSTMIHAALQGLSQPVTMLYYTSDVDSWYTHAERQLLEEIARASAHVELRVQAGRWDSAREEAVGIRRTPVIALYGDKDSGIRYYGAPDGYELETFLNILCAVAEGRSGLSASTVAHVRQLTQPVHLEVIVSPT